MRTKDELVEIAESILTGHLSDAVEYSLVYEADEAAGLSEDEQIEVYELINSASYDVRITGPKVTEPS